MAHGQGALAGSFYYFGGLILRYVLLNIFRLLWWLVLSQKEIASKSALKHDEKDSENVKLDTKLQQPSKVINNLKGKTIVPFMTSGGSYIINSENELKE